MDYSSMFIYDETSASSVRWKFSRYGGKTWKTVVQFAGSVAGNLNSRTGNWSVSYVPFPKAKRVRVMAHHIVLALHGVDIPLGMVVDHIDGDYSNNKFENLRIVSQTCNTRNSKGRSHNTSGFTGVGWQTIKGNRYASVQWKEGNKNHCKRFSVNKLGESDAFKCACEFRLNKIDELNLKGYGYSERHGILDGTEN